MKLLHCMNCRHIITKGKSYKLEIPSRDPVCEDCWPIFKKYLSEIGATEDFDNFEFQEVLVR